MRITLIAFAAMLVAPPPLLALDADELVARNIEARGGIERIKAIRTLRSEGKLTVGGDNPFEMDLALTVSREGKVRSEGSLQGMTLVQAYDGEVAWQIQPFQGRKDPDRMSADDAMDLLDSADIDGPLVDYKAKGHKLEYLGTQDVDGTQAHKLKLSEKDGDVKTIYLDPDYFLEIRITSQRKVRGAEVETESDLGNYEKVAGVYMPYSIEVGEVDGDKAQKITWNKVEVDVPVADDYFAFPATAAK